MIESIKVLEPGAEIVPSGEPVLDPRMVSRRTSVSKEVIVNYIQFVAH